MRTGPAVMNLGVHVYASTAIEARAYAKPATGYGLAFVSIEVGDGHAGVALMVNNPEVLDRLMDAVADARTGLLRVTRESDARQPELVAS